jgi:hypothetical protein
MSNQYNLFRLTLVLFFITTIAVNGQVASKDHRVLTLQGKVIHKETGQPIYNTNIILGDTYTGTSTNELGEFVIKVTSFPAQLIFSHLNYDSQTLIISDNKAIRISLIPIINSLETVNLSYSGKDQYAIDLAKKAFYKTTKTSNNIKFGRALYRQTSKNDEDYSEFSEIIYDIEYSTSGINDWDIIEGRYALKEEKINNKNYTLFSRLLKALQPDTKDIFFPLNKDLEKFYYIRTIQKIKSKTSEIAVLWFKPIEKSAETPFFEGEVYVDTNTYDVLKVTGEITRDDLELSRLTDENAFKKKHKLSYEMAFKVDPSLGLTLDYIDVHQEFDYYKYNDFKTHVSSKSSLNFFQYYTPASQKRLGTQFKRNTSDWNRLNEIGYNKKFWEDNPIVKRTPVEEEIITYFETNNPFESIFINSKNQIGQLGSNISNLPFIKELDEKLILYNTDNPIEKVFIHTDKDICSPGDDIWLSGYVILGAGNYYSLASKVLFIDLIDSNGETISAQKQEIIQGRSKGLIALPKNIASGTYQLRGYTNWMRNEDERFYFTKTLKVLNENVAELPAIIENDRLDLQFLPEGGNVVAGLDNVIAFKGLGMDGLSRDVQGIIIDSKGGTVAVINSIYKGAGFFNLNPTIGETYKAVLDNKSEIMLPKAQNNGYVLSVNNHDKSSIRVSVQATEELRDKTFYIIGLLRNQKYYQASFTFGNNKKIDFEIPKNSLPSGVMTLTLFDEDKIAQNERVLFINNAEELVIETKIITERFRSRDKIDMYVSVKDKNGQPVSTDISLAVTDAERIQKDIKSENILTHLLLQSELKGHIESPGTYFKDRDRATQAKLDLVMLTNGWRRLNWKALRNESIKQPKEYPFSQGISISGVLREKDSKGRPNTSITAFSKGKDSENIYYTVSKADGSFSINDINQSDSLNLDFVAYNKIGKPIDVVVSLDKIKSQKSENRRLVKTRKIKDNSQAEQDYIEASKLKREAALRFGYLDATELDEVLLKGKSNQKETLITSRPSEYGIKPDAVVYFEEGMNNFRLSDVLGRLSGVRAYTVNNPLTSQPELKVVFRGEETPLIVLDGIPMEIESLNQLGGSIAQNLERAEIQKNGAAYGSRGMFGVILLYSRKGRGKTITNNTKQFAKHTIMGYATAKEFYAPKYDVKLEKHKKPDYRETLYWNPNIRTDENGKATITFYNSDISETIQVDIQGLSDTGIPGVYLETFGKK